MSLPGGGGLPGTGSGSSIVPDWAAWCVSEDPRGVFVSDIDKLREMTRGEWGQLSRDMPRLPLPDKEIQPLPKAFQHERFDQFVGIFTQQGHVVGALHAKKEGSLEETATALGFSAEDGEEHASFRYVKIPGGFLAEITPQVLCFAEQESDLQAALERAANRTEHPLPEMLAQAAKYARGDQRICVLSPTTFKRRPMTHSLPSGSAPEWLAAGVSVGKSMRLKLTVQLKSAEEARKLAAQMRPPKDPPKGLEKTIESAPPELRKVVQDAFEATKRITRGISASSSGKRVTLTMTISLSDVKKLLEMVKKAKEFRSQQMQRMFGR